MTAQSLDQLRARRLTSFQLMLLAKQTGSALVAAEADAQAVVERIRKAPKLLPLEATVTAEQAAALLTAAFRAGRRSYRRMN